MPLIVCYCNIQCFHTCILDLATRAIKGDLAVLASSCFFGSILLFPAIFFVDYSGNTINLGVVYGFISGVVHIVCAFVGLCMLMPVVIYQSYINCEGHRCMFNCYFCSSITRRNYFGRFLWNTDNFSRHCTNDI